MQSCSKRSAQQQQPSYSRLMGGRKNLFLTSPVGRHFESRCLIDQNQKVVLGKASPTLKTPKSTPNMKKSQLKSMRGLNVVVLAAILKTVMYRLGCKKYLYVTRVDCKAINTSVGSIIAY